MLPREGPYIHGGPGCGHWPPSEPTEPTGVGFTGIFWTGQPYWKFQTAATLPPHVDVVAGLTGKIAALNIQLNPWVAHLAV